MTRYRLRTRVSSILYIYQVAGSVISFRRRRTNEAWTVYVEWMSRGPDRRRGVGNRAGDSRVCRLSGRHVNVVERLRRWRFKTHTSSYVRTKLQWRRRLGGFRSWSRRIRFNRRKKKGKESTIRSRTKNTFSDAAVPPGRCARESKNRVVLQLRQCGRWFIWFSFTSVVVAMKRNMD